MAAPLIKQPSFAQPANANAPPSLFTHARAFSELTKGVASSFRDIMNFRNSEPPQLEVCEPQIKGGATGKHHQYRIKGLDH
jgi:hypothetical protein